MTTVRVLTPAGRGAIATVAVEGDLRVLDGSPPLFRAASGSPAAVLPLNRVTFGSWGAAPAEEVVICRTASDVIEVHCHGGAAAVARIVAALVERGCVHPPPVPETSAGDEIAAECRSALARATTLRTADILLQQQSGLLQDTFERLERADGDAARREIDDLLAWSEFGRHLVEPWRVVLCGRPNVGKSSLINALAGFERSIVVDEPGTTRDVVTIETAIDGWPVQLSDTAGLRDVADVLESAGIARARRAVDAADLRVVLLDTSIAPQPEDRRLLETWSDALVVAHKCDLPCVWGEELPRHALAVSSLTGEGVAALMEAMARRLAPSVPAPMAPIPFTSRQVDVLYRLRRRLAAPPPRRP